MKAISLWQPWASLMAAGIKRIETRSWSTAYRGPLLICAAKRVEACPYLFTHQLIHPQLQDFNNHHWGDYPEGVALAVVNLYGVTPTEDALPGTLEEALGNYTPGRFAWLTNDCRPLRKLIPVRGRQRLFNVDYFPKRPPRSTELEEPSCLAPGVRATCKHCGVETRPGQGIVCDDCYSKYTPGMLIDLEDNP
jgi:hypothetical protein